LQPVLENTAITSRVNDGSVAKVIGAEAAMSANITIFSERRRIMASDSIREPAWRFNGDESSHAGCGVAAAMTTLRPIPQLA
jgi:hypothetical protein